MASSDTAVPITTAPTIVFDLDGTLVDTAPDLIAALNTILAREGLPELPYATARNMVGGGARHMIEAGLAAEGRTASADEVERMCRDFISHYADHIDERSRPFPGVEDALSRLAGAGCRLAVCTNKLEWLSLKLLSALRLRDRFAAICGADTFGVAKPNAAILHGTLARAGGSTDCAIMVGDAVPDIAVARAAGIAVIAVDFGYSPTPVVALSPDRVVSSFERVPEAVFALLGLEGDEFSQRVNG
jgi:phosphoglycolate phosphatase